MANQNFSINFVHMANQIHEELEKWLTIFLHFQSLYFALRNRQILTPILKAYSLLACEFISP